MAKSPRFDPFDAEIAPPEAARTLAVINRVTRERLTVELEIGDQLWLRNEKDVVELARRSELPAELWDVVSVGQANCWPTERHFVPGHKPTECEVERVPVFTKS